MSKSKISWTDETWNPVVGCSKVSSGCQHCYAVRDAHRMAGNPNPTISQTYSGLTIRHDNGQLDWSGEVRCIESRLSAPLHWKRPRRVFVNSLSDLFHENVPGEFIAAVFGIMAACPQHTFQILTKRPERMAALLVSGDFILDLGHLANKYHNLPRVVLPLPNVWLGTSVESEAYAHQRIPALLDTPATVRFLSCEPLLGDIVSIKSWVGSGKIGWVIAGGESGPTARPMLIDWALRIRNACEAYGVPYFFKQWGEWVPLSQIVPPPKDMRSKLPMRAMYHPAAQGQQTNEHGMVRLGKSNAGHYLGNTFYQEWP